MIIKSLVLIWIIGMLLEILLPSPYWLIGFALAIISGIVGMTIQILRPDSGEGWKQ